MSSPRPSTLDAFTPIPGAWLDLAAARRSGRPRLLSRSARWCCCEVPSSTSTLPRSTTHTANSSRASFARAGSRDGCPTSTAGWPLFSESQAGYFHPFKYLLYPWMATWKAFNLDTVLIDLDRPAWGHVWMAPSPRSIPPGR